MKNKELRNKKGITLIALVITIIVLLILAGVSIVMLSGENGIISKAQFSKERTELAGAKEKLILLLNEYKIKSSVDLIAFYDFFLEKKQNNEIQDIIDNHNGTYWITIDNYEFLVKVEDLTILDENKLVGECPSITHEFVQEGSTGKIILKVSTNDSQGILQIINQNGNTIKYENQEKDVTTEYTVNCNGRYIFVIEAGNGRKCSYEVEITELDIFNESYEKDIDYQTVTQIYETAKKEQTEEQFNIINQAGDLYENINMLAAEHVESSDSWTLWGQSKTEKLNGYYIYDKYNASSTTTYKEGEWSPWQSTNLSIASNTCGYRNYSFDESTGLFTVSGSYSFSPYTNVCRYGPIHLDYDKSKNTRTLTEYKCTSSSYGSPKYSRTKTAIPETSYSKGSYLTDVLLPNSYPEDGVAEEFWYIKKGETNQYYGYKFQNNTIKSVYDPIKRVIETKTIDLGENVESIKLTIKSENNDYRISILDASGNWKKISDYSELDTGKIIQLSKKSNQIKIQIELNSSIINQIVLNKIS